MSEVKWIKLTTNIFDDEKIRLIDAMDERDVLFYIWIRLLTMAGKTNEGGKVYLSTEMPYTEEMVATIFNRQVKIVGLALKVFEKLKMIKITAKKDIEILNWTKHQNIDGLEKIREQSRQRVKKYRDKKITVIKYKNKTRYRRKLGHRQNITLVKIDKI